MERLQFLSCSFGGAFLANEVPRIVGGVMGRRERSLPMAYASWGFFNRLVGCVFVGRVGHFERRNTCGAVALGPCIVAPNWFIARLFGRIHGDKATWRS
jgi:hypothetical protein